MRCTPIALMLLLAGPAAAAEGVVSCTDFRDAWSRSLGKLDLGRPPSYGAPDRAGAEPVEGLAGLQAAMTCRDGVLGRLELRTADGARFGRAAASILMALDREITQDEAAAMVAALRAEARSAKKPASSSWGPYDLTVSGPGTEAQEELTLDLPEN